MSVRGEAERELSSDSDSSGPRDDSRVSEIRARVDALIAIAAEHDAPMRIEDAFQLLPFRAFRSVAEFETFLRDDPVLKTRVSIEGPLVVDGRKRDLVSSYAESGRITDQRVGIARSFVGRLVQKLPWVIVAGVSGSTIYGHTRPSDDLDFFLVVARRRMWIALLGAFLLGRIDRTRDHSPTYCFNRTLEDYECLRDLNDQKEPLIAREALTMIVLHGEGYYASLLSKSNWMARYFPLLYEARTKAQDRISKEQRFRRGGAHLALLNALAFMLVATYLVVTGFLRNAHLARQGRHEARFRTVVRPGFCAYESNRYDGLRDAYREAIR